MYLWSVRKRRKSKCWPSRKIHRHDRTIRLNRYLCTQSVLIGFIVTVLDNRCSRKKNVRGTSGAVDAVKRGRGEVSPLSRTNLSTGPMRFRLVAQPLTRCYAAGRVGTAVVLINHVPCGTAGYRRPAARAPENGVGVDGEGNRARRPSVRQWRPRVPCEPARGNGPGAAIVKQWVPPRRRNRDNRGNNYGRTSHTLRRRFLPTIN